MPSDKPEATGEGMTDDRRLHLRSVIDQTEASRISLVRYRELLDALDVATDQLEAQSRTLDAVKVAGLAMQDTALECILSMRGLRPDLRTKLNERIAAFDAAVGEGE